MNDSVSSEEFWIGEQVSRTSVRGDLLKDESRKYVIVTEQSAPASHLTMVSFERYFEITWLCWMSKWYRERIYSSQNKRDARNSLSYGDCQENWMRIPIPRKRTFRLNYEPVRWSGPGFSKKRKSEKVHLKSDGNKTPEDSAFTSIDNYNSHCFL